MTQDEAEKLSLYCKHDTSANTVTAWNTGPQPAPPAGEPDFVAHAARNFDEEFNVRDLARGYEYMYRLGLTARSKVEDVEVANVISELRSYTKGIAPTLESLREKAANLLERLAIDLHQRMAKDRS